MRKSPYLRESIFLALFVLLIAGAVWSVVIPELSSDREKPEPVVQTPQSPP